MNSPTKPQGQETLTPQPSEKTEPDSPRSTAEDLSVSALINIIEARYGDPRTFVLNMRLWLKQNRITQQALSDELGLDLTNINRWLNCRIVPGLKNMLLMDEAVERIINRRSA